MRAARVFAGATDPSDAVLEARCTRRG